MQLACIHTHTVFCDGSDDIETFCQTAYRKGLASIGFSAHAPITKKTGISTHWNLPDEKLDEYLDAVRAAKKRWEGKLPVYLGLEVDYISGLMGPADSDYREMGLDYILAAVHFVFPPGGEPLTVDDNAENVDRLIKVNYSGDPLAMVEAYYDSMEKMIRAGGFDILGHPDVVKKSNTGNRLFSEDAASYKKRTAALAALTAAAGIPAEINTGGMNRGRIKDCYPSSGLLKLFREHGVPMVINADAHRAEDLDGHYEDARRALLAAGYSETLIFEGRKDGRAVWRSVGL